MYLRSLALTDFRCYTSCDVELPQGAVAFVGENGAGKTNLVEAAGYLATLGSHRVATDAPLVRTGAASAHVAGVLVRDERSVRLDVQIIAGRANKAWLNRSPVPRPREILGYARVVTFAPEDVVLIRGDPDERRRYVDDLIVLRAPRMAAVRADLDRALRQRNALLRQLLGTGRSGQPAGLDEWDEMFAAPAAELITARRALLAALAGHVTTAYEMLAPERGLVGLRYRSSVHDRLGLSAAERPDPDTTPVTADEVRGALLQARREELARGTTVVGPHRDDILVTLGPRPAKGFASHGETWSIALALRLASFELLTDDWGDTPILVLDDVFAELDTARRSQLVALALRAEQVLVTAAVPADVPPEIGGARLTVSDGVVDPGKVVVDG